MSRAYVINKLTFDALYIALRCDGQGMEIRAAAEMVKGLSDK